MAVHEGAATDGGDVEVEQFSKESRELLRGAAAALTAALEEHTATFLASSGGSSTFGLLSELGDQVHQAASVWNDAVFTHAGFIPLPLTVPDETDEFDFDDEDDPAEPVTELAVSVVSRWDLNVTDVAAVVDAGRAAHRRMDPSESAADAAFVIGDSSVGQALYALVHEHGEPWFDLPGVAGMAGCRFYLHRDDNEPALTDDDGDDGDDGLVMAPEGRVLYSESW